MCKRALFISLSVALVPVLLGAVAVGTEIKVDFGAAGVLDGTWTEWNEVSGSRTVDGVEFNFSNSGLTGGPKLRAESNGGNDALTGDSLSAEDEGTGGYYEMTISNLAAGNYELVTYFNIINSAWGWSCAMQVLVNGTVQAGPTDAAAEKSSADATRLSVTFLSSGTGDVTTIRWELTGAAAGPFICGFELLSQGPTIQFVSAASGDVESVSPAVLEVILTNPEADQAYTVDYSVTGGTAVGGGVDYFLAAGCVCDFDGSGQVGFSDIAVLTANWLTQAPGGMADLTDDSSVDFQDFALCALEWFETCGSNTLVFAAGETDKTIEIEIVQDALAEEDETVIVELSNPTGPEVVRDDMTDCSGEKQDGGYPRITQLANGRVICVYYWSTSDHIENHIAATIWK